MSKKEIEIPYANSKWLLRNPFCCCSYLSNFFEARSENEYGFRKPGLKTGWKNDNFGLKLGTHQEFSEVPPDPSVHCCHCPGDVAVCMCEVLAIPRNHGVGSVSFTTDCGLAFLARAFSFGVGNEFVLIMYVILSFLECSRVLKILFVCVA